MKLLKGLLIALLIMMILCFGAVTVMSSKDTDHSPVIKSTSDIISIPCLYTEKDLLEGLTAYDEEDGDITKEILIRNYTKFSKPGSCEIEYAVFDSKGNYAEYKRKVEFFDYESPKITLTEPLVFVEESYADYSLRYFLRARDRLDGDLTKHIKIENPVFDYRISGTYKAAVSLQNSFGDSIKMDIPVHVLSNIQRGLEIKLTEPLIYVEQNEKIVPEDFIASVQLENSSQMFALEDCEVIIESTVDYTKKGVYEIGYTIYAPDKVLYGKTWLTVVVGEYGG